MDKAYLRLIDLYEISLFTAKALMGMKLHEAGDRACRRGRSKSWRRARRRQGEGRKERLYPRRGLFLMKGGQPVRAVRKMTAEDH